MQGLKQQDMLIASVEAELRRETARSLRRVGDQLEALIDELRTLAERWHAAPLAQAPALRTRYDALRERALERRWVLTVQREAMGLYVHHEVDVHYPIPPRLR